MCQAIRWRCCCAALFHRKSYPLTEATDHVVWAMDNSFIHRGVGLVVLLSDMTGSWQRPFSNNPQLVVGGCMVVGF